MIPINFDHRNKQPISLGRSHSIKTLTPKLSGLVIGRNISWWNSTSSTVVSKSFSRGKILSTRAASKIYSSQYARLERIQMLVPLNHTTPSFLGSRERAYFMPRHIRLPLEKLIKYFSNSVLRVPSSLSHLSGMNTAACGKIASLACMMTLVMPTGVPFGIIYSWERPL